MTAITVPSIFADSWNLRSICSTGSVLPNALCTADVDGDGDEEVVFATSEGDFVILKSNYVEPLFLYSGLTTVSVILAKSKSLLVVVTLEGLCHILHIAPFSALELKQQFKTSYAIPVNCHCAAMDDKFLYFGSSNRRVHIYPLINGTLGDKGVSLFLFSQVFSISLFSYRDSPLLLVATTEELMLLPVNSSALELWATVTEGSNQNVNVYLQKGIVIWSRKISQVRDKLSNDSKVQVQSVKSKFESNSSSNHGGGKRDARFPAVVETFIVGNSAYLAVATEDGNVWLMVLQEASGEHGPLVEHVLLNLGTYNARLTLSPCWEMKTDPLIHKVLLRPVDGALYAIVFSNAGSIYIRGTRSNELLLCDLQSELCTATPIRGSSSRDPGFRLMVVGLEEVMELIVSPIKPYYSSYLDSATLNLLDSVANEVGVSDSNSSVEQRRKKIVQMCLEGYSTEEWNKLAGVQGN